MSDANRVQLTAVVEATVGTTPNTPRMRKMRFTGESLRYVPQTVTSDTIRDDRMNDDPIKVGEQNDGGVNFELHYPVADSILAGIIESAFQSTWSNTNVRDNDITADSVITAAIASSDTYTVTTGTAWVAGMLVRATGFTNSGNNQVFRAQTGSSATAVVAPSSPGLTDEAAPPAGARLKQVGFQGASGDITATASGLASTLLDFTAMGVTAGMWLKVGGSAAGDKFATAALNDWVRATAVSANAITLDNLPSGWTTDSGTSKTIRVFMGDVIKNGVTLSALSLERGFKGQASPTYILQAGMAANTFGLNFQAKQKITASVAFMGLSGGESASSVDASPDDAPAPASYPIMACGVNVGRVAEAGSSLSSPNWVRSLQIQINNNLGMKDAIDSTASVGHTSGECAVTVNAETYFGSRSLLTKLLAGTPTSMNARANKDSRAIIVTLPRLTPLEGSPNASAKNSQVMLPLSLAASYDSTTGSHIMMQRTEYYE